MGTKSNTPQKYLVAVGENIHYYRLKRGLTLEALGQDIGVDKARMHKMERGQNLTLTTLLRLSAVLEVSIAKIIDTDVAVSYEDTERFVKNKQDRRQSSGVKSKRKSVRKKSSSKPRK